MDNLFANVPDQAIEELTDVLINNQSFRVERIVSNGQSSPDGFWYDQTETEWVVLLSGQASLRFEERDDIFNMNRGDFIEIPAGVRHRVDSTSKTEATIWLAIFYAPDKKTPDT